MFNCRNEAEAEGKVARSSRHQDDGGAGDYVTSISVSVGACASNGSLLELVRAENATQTVALFGRPKRKAVTAAGEVVTNFQRI